MAGISILCLVLAFLLHGFGWKQGGKKAYLASEPIHKAPGLKTIYDLAENRIFDLYEQGVVFLRGLSMVLFRGIDRPIDFVYEKVVTWVGGAVRVSAPQSPQRPLRQLSGLVPGRALVVIAVISVLV